LSHFEAGRRGDIFDAVLGELGVEASRDLVAELVGAYRSHVPDISLLPDASRFLDRLAGRAALALLTDGYLETQRRKIRALDVAHRFAEVVCTDAWGRDYWKPHRRSYLHIEERFPQAGRFAYIADNPTKDFFVPRERGWLSVRLRRDRGLYAGLEDPPAGAAALSARDLDEAWAHLAAAGWLGVTTGRRGARGAGRAAPATGPRAVPPAGPENGALPGSGP
jgi:putative hydrolase of the HAD superfamily